ncbi:efflux RND transporter periplasmic adaptor subunit [Luteimonas sp. FXH3W]|uniref:Efflux RND transporter periplasmic adaptor subunit n=1 Tax=Aquilutibacter rugosus TaxID=3115820 RepID=A0ABU7UZB8_9GAMM
MRTHTSIRPAALALALVAVLSVTACKDKDAAAAAGAGAGQMPPAAVTVVTIQSGRQVIESELPGRVVASQMSEVRPQVSGIIQRRLFTEGGYVRAGQALYQLDDSQYRADTASARAQLAAAEATAASAQSTAARAAQLVKMDAISKQENDNAQAAYNQAVAAVRAQQAILSGSQVQLGRARITAPISGVIGASSVTAGALVTAGQATVLATIQSLDPVYIDVTQSSSEYLRTRKAIADGQGHTASSVPVKIVLEDGSEYPQAGRLAFSSTLVDPSTGSYTTRIVVPNPNNLLLPGMYVRAIVGSSERDNAIVVPQMAVSRDAKGGTSVMVVGKDNKVESRPIVVSSSMDNGWLVESGLKDGDRVIMEGQQKVQPGATVNARPYVAKAPVQPRADKPAAAAPAAH